MLIKINGQVIENTSVQSLSVYSEEETFRMKVRTKMKELFPKAVSVSALLGVLNMAGQALAASGAVSLADRMLPLIHMVQDLALPAAIVVSSWGLIEVIIGNIESGKEKLKYSVIGFIGMFLVPEIFYAIRDAFSKSLGH